MKPEKIEPWEPTTRELEMYALSIRGKSYAWLEKEFGIGHSTAHRICKRIDAWLAPQLMDQIREMKANHTSRLMHLFAEAMDAWEKSKLDAEVKTAEIGGKGGNKATKTTKGQCGNSSYLDQARACLADIRKIWGADAPLKVEHSGEIRVAGDIEGARQRMREELQKRMSQLEPSSN